MKKLIPPTLFLSCIVLMIVIRYRFSSNDFTSYPLNLVGIILIIVGSGFTLLIRRQFDQNKAEIHTFKVPKKIITNGLFKYSRNPIYLGFTMALTGIWLLTGNLLTFIGVFIFFMVSNFWYIPHEEKMMEKEFGAEYEKYKSKVRRWI